MAVLDRWVTWGRQGIASGVRSFRGGGRCVQGGRGAAKLMGGQAPRAAAREERNKRAGAGEGWGASMWAVG